MLNVKVWIFFTVFVIIGLLHIISAPLVEDLLFLLALNINYNNCIHPRPKTAIKYGFTFEEHGSYP